MPKKPRSKAKKASDKAYNARRRFTRAAERYLKKAKESFGAVRMRFEELARENTQKAIATYDPATRQKISSPIKKLAERFGYDLETRRETYVNERTFKLRERLISQSEKTKISAISDDQERADEEARALLKNTQVGKRIMGGLVDVWRDYATPEQREKAIVDYFGVDNISEVIQKLESKFGEDLYQELENDEKYDEIKYAIQSAINRGNLVD